MRFSGQVSEPSKSEPTATSEADSTVESSEDAQMETAALQQNLWAMRNALGNASINRLTGHRWPTLANRGPRAGRTCRIIMWQPDRS